LVCPSQSGQTDWGFRLREAHNNVLTLHAIPNFYFQQRARIQNHGLGSEVFYEFNLLAGEKAHLLAIKTDHAD
jgi:hypothetical protein